MVVSLQRRLTNASRDLDAATNISFFQSVSPEIVATLDIGRAGDEWNYGTSQASLTAGQIISWNFPAVPRQEMHEYYFICPTTAEAGDKTWTLSIDNPAPTVGATYIVAHRIVDGQRGINILGQWSQVDTSSGVQHPTRLMLPPGFTMSFDCTTGLVGAGPTNTFLTFLRRVVDPPGQVEAVAAIPSVIT